MAFGVTFRLNLEEI